MQVVESGGFASGTTISAGGYEILQGGGLASASVAQRRRRANRRKRRRRGTARQSLPEARSRFSAARRRTATWSGRAAFWKSLPDTRCPALRCRAASRSKSAMAASHRTLSCLHGGELSVLSGGLADPTTISTGSIEVVGAGGTDLGALISGGGQDVFGYASGATCSSGVQVVESGGTAINTVVSSGGVLELSTGAVATASPSKAAVRSMQLPASRFRRRTKLRSIQRSCWRMR